MTAALALGRTPTRARRLAVPLATAAVLGAATLALHLRDPHVSGSWGFCPLYATTGIYCPFCGGLRAVNDLTSGHLGAALSSNLVVVAAIPVAVYLWGAQLARAWDGRPAAQLRPWFGSALLVLLGVFMVLRNTPYGAWLAP